MKLRILAAVMTIGLAAGALLGRSSAQSESDSYLIDEVHSSAIFRIKHAGASYFYGRFNQVEGEFTHSPDSPDQISFNVNIRADNVDTNNSKRNAHLKSADFFNAMEFPNITFKSTKVKKLDGNNYEVTGDLSLHGVTKPLTTKIEFVGEGEAMGKHRAGWDTTFTIKRSEFGMTKYLDDGSLGDEVKLMVGLEGIRK